MINFQEQKKESNEVLLSTQDSVQLSKNDIDELIGLAKKNISKKIRFCSHKSPNELIHEMFIVHPKEMYVRPHKHINKIESMIVLSGEVDYILLNDQGEIDKIIEMGDINSGKEFYISTKDETFHSLLIKSDFLVFLEITNGPFKKEDTIFAPWSPVNDDITNIEIFMEKLKKVIND